MNQLYKAVLFVFGLAASITVAAQSPLNSQNFPEWTFQPGPGGNTYHPAPITNGWMIPFNVDECSREMIAYVNKNTGNVKYFPVLGDGSAGYILNDILQTGPNEFICAGFIGKGYDVISLMHGFVYKMDSLGKVKWSFVLQKGSLGTSIIEGFNRVVVGNDGSIYALAPKKCICKIDTNGKKLWLKTNSDITDILYSSTGKLLAAGTGHIWQLDTSGSVMKDFSFSSNYFKTLSNLPGKLISAAEEGKISVLDSNLHVVRSAGFGFGFPDKASLAMAVATDSAYFFYDRDSLVSLDLKGNRNWTAGLPDGNNISGLAWDGKQLSVVGNGPAVFFKIFDKKGNTSPIPRDIGVVNVVATKITYNPSWLNSNMPPFDINANVNVTVKNYGTEIVDSFYLGSIGPHASDYYACYEMANQGYQKVNLLPGDSITVPIFIKRILVNPGPKGYLLDFKINTISPNGKMDNNTANDSYHYSNAFSGIKGDAVNDADIHMYPNPVSHTLILDNTLENINTSLAVFNITGQEIIAYKDIPAHFEINMEKLPSGLYTVRLQNKNGSTVKRIVKE
jgi:hypothetical protein